MKHFDAIISGTGQAGPSLPARFSDVGKTVAIIGTLQVQCHLCEHGTIRDQQLNEEPPRRRPLLKQGKAVRAMVRNENARAQALRAEVVAGDLLDLGSMDRIVAGRETIYFGMSVSDTYLAATVNAAVPSWAVCGLESLHPSPEDPGLRR